MESNLKTIDTAPKDGTIIICFRSSEFQIWQGKSLVVCAWYDDLECFTWPDDDFYNEYDSNKFWELVEAGSYHDNSFTHWMPLPKEPLNEG